MEYPRFSSQTRTKALEDLRSGQPPVYDAFVIGGGIVGVGAARELAIRGLKTLLVEKNDFASGTSSRSSKLIHGGLRYLEMLDFKLVFEALSERHWLLKTHPHLVKPLEFVLPAYEAKHAPPKARSGALLGMGLWLYDALSLFRTPFFHGWYDGKKLIEKFPGIRALGLKGGYYYADAMMLDDELVLECALDAKRRGAELLNYVSATKVSKTSNGLYQIDLVDELSPGVATSPLKVFAKEVIVCVGPWTERVGSLIEGGAKKKLKPSKGVHLVVPWKRFPVDSVLVMYAPDGRIIFIIPRKDLGSDAEMVIIGTTDSPELGDPSDVSTSESDVDYLLQVLAEYFPEVGLTRNDIVNTYAGVRPLIDDGAETEAKTSREHEIWRNDQGVVFVAGGKYTTFRPMSQEIVDFSHPQSALGIKRKEFDKISKEHFNKQLNEIHSAQKNINLESHLQKFP